MIRGLQAVADEIFSKPTVINVDLRRLMSVRNFGPEKIVDKFYDFMVSAKRWSIKREKHEIVSHQLVQELYNTLSDSAIKAVNVVSSIMTSPKAKDSDRLKAAKMIIDKLVPDKLIRELPGEFEGWTVEQLEAFVKGSEKGVGRKALITSISEIEDDTI